MQVGGNKVNVKVGCFGYYHQHRYHFHFHFIETLSESVILQYENTDKSALHLCIKSLVNNILTRNVLLKKFPYYVYGLLYLSF